MKSAGMRGRSSSVAPLKSLPYFGQTDRPEQAFPGKMANPANRRRARPRGYKYVHSFTDKTGKRRNYFRRGKIYIALPERMETAEFKRAYDRALIGVPEQIRAKAQKYEAQAEHATQGRQQPLIGVYLLLLNDQVVYIGSSMNMSVRVAAHKANGRPFDQVFYIGTKMAERGTLERTLIRAFQPRQNRTLKSLKS